MFIIIVRNYHKNFGFGRLKLKCENCIQQLATHNVDMNSILWDVYKAW